MPLNWFRGLGGLDGRVAAAVWYLTNGLNEKLKEILKSKSGQSINQF